MNPSFSTKNPYLQLALDSTSIGDFKTCPRLYYYRMNGIEPGLGYAPRTESVHLTFGLLFHSAVERYHHYTSRAAEIDTMGHEEALQEVVRWAMCATWDKETGPWESGDKAKNRFSLIRTIVWYLDTFKDDYIQTITLANGKPAVELSFGFHSHYLSATGEDFVLCGHLDRLGRLGNSNYIIDLKSTGSTINDRFFDRFTPDNQMTLYCIAGKTAFGVDTEGIIVDACQITVTGFVERGGPFMRKQIPRSQFQLDEWHEALGYHLENLEWCATNNQWPQNDKACNLYGGCPFRPVCYAPSKEARQQVLAANYVPRQWNPLEKRGDI